MYPETGMWLLQTCNGPNGPFRPSCNGPFWILMGHILKSQQGCLIENMLYYSSHSRSFNNWCYIYNRKDYIQCVSIICELNVVIVKLNFQYYIGYHGYYP